MSETGHEEFSEAAGSTGVDAVDEALASLQGLESSPVDGHPAVFEAVHDALRAVLSGDSQA